jgi:hypothetical protein
MIDELNNSCNFLKKKIRRELVGSSYIKNMIKNVAMTDEEILISCLNDLINL